uniref:Uncharacterized protein n=1 Tax=Gasterosteus aculeatus aculeatus TaxID=481459 RepID=A0AAQ4P3B3_GASAC
MAGDGATIKSRIRNLLLRSPSAKQRKSRETFSVTNTSCHPTSSVIQREIINYRSNFRKPGFALIIVCMMITR